MTSVQRLAIGKAPLGNFSIEDTRMSLLLAKSQLVLRTSDYTRKYMTGIKLWMLGSSFYLLQQVIEWESSS